MTNSISTRRLGWLEDELARWQQQGLLDAPAATAIRNQYDAGPRLPLSRLLLGLGAAFVGVGLLWLVAANLEQVSPLVRFVGIAAVWLAAVVAAEAVASRRAGAVVGALRLVAALAFGGVVFQAGQSLQVPAYDAELLGAWGAGALLYAYAAAAVAPLAVGILAGAGWFVWLVAERTGSVAGTAVALLLAAVLATAVAVAHRPQHLPQFAPPWRLTAALLALVGLFLAALPQLDGRDAAWPTSVALAALAALGAAGAATVRADRTGRSELGAVVGSVVLAVLLLRWRPPEVDSAADLSGEGLLRAVVAIAVYLLAAAWFAVLGVLREARGLTQLATAGLVVFTVVQSFAVFEPILSGAALFLVLGVVVAGAGWLVDRGRRRLVAEVTA